MPKPFPYSDSHHVPWKYDMTLIFTRTRKKEVCSIVSSGLSGLIRSGQCYTPKEWRKGGKRLARAQLSQSGIGSPLKKLRNSWKSSGRPNIVWCNSWTNLQLRFLFSPVAIFWGSLWGSIEGIEGNACSYRYYRLFLRGYGIISVGHQLGLLFRRWVASRRKISYFGHAYHGKVWRHDCHKGINQ